MAQPREQKRRNLPWWGWALIAVAGIGFTILVPQVALPMAVVALITGIVGWAKGWKTWLRLRSKKSAVGLTAVASVAVLLAGGSATALAGLPQEPEPDVAALSGVNSTAEPTAKKESAVPRPVSTPKGIPTPTPTPTEEYRDEAVIEAIPFAESTVDDPDLPVGESRVVTEGVAGERTRTYRVTEIDGQEIGRELVSDEVTTAPVDRVTANGTYVAPPLPPEPEAPVPAAGSAGGGCDSNYADACVPVSSDVDCASGSGNGPAYFDGIARVVGSDVYDLDRDGDGYACEP